jgi:hypothetical protein
MMRIVDSARVCHVDRPRTAARASYIVTGTRALICLGRNRELSYLEVIRPAGEALFATAEEPLIAL